MRLHFHSDTPFFAGCDNMLAAFFNDDSFRGSYDLTFSYRYSLRYEEGLEAKVFKPVRRYPLHLLDAVGLTQRMQKLFEPLRSCGIVGAQCVRYFYIFYNMVVLYRLFRKIQPDVLHINNGGYPGAYSCMSAVFAARMAGVRKIVYVVNNVAIPYDRLWRKLDYFFDRIVARQVSIFITGSVYAKKQLATTLRLPEDKAISIPNGIFPQVPQQDRIMLAQRLGLDQGRLIIGVAALLEERKGHIYLLQALKLFRESAGDSLVPYVLVAGGGELLPRLQQFVDSQGLASYVKFLGVERNIFDFMNAIDLLGLPSIYGEDFPFVILEAMSLGKPVIASRICGIPEEIEDGASGILVEPGDAPGLARAMRFFSEDRSRLGVFGRRAKQIFDEKFYAAHAVAAYRELYRKLF